MSMSTDANPAKPQPRWQPISSRDRRVLGVLAEKAKTTPDAYPMSINALCAGANQKNNRYPLMQLEPDDVEESLDRLRELGAVAVLQGAGRVSKYRHYLYDWLGVDKVELAVMAELLLRGTQTEGELRGRAARMEPIADLSALRPVLDSLKAKGLVIPLTPAGRGAVVTHALYEPRELEKQRAEFSGAAVQPAEPAGATSAPPVRAAAPPAAPPSGHAANEAETLRREIADLRNELAELRQTLDEFKAEFQSRAADFDRLKDALGA
ncbi:MAG TPA: DUF480 domain-containing protein [Pirellulales bacterium]|nr:DUF480 domain-containing protein [Pirellulales bacterium]